jgi:hypothetical protein
MSAAWAKSVGFEERKKFGSKACKKCVSQIADNTYEIKIKDQNVIVSDDENEPDAIFLDEDCDFAKLIYLPSRKCESNESKKRPWS